MMVWESLYPERGEGRYHDHEKGHVGERGRKGEEASLLSRLVFSCLLRNRTKEGIAQEGEQALRVEAEKRVNDMVREGVRGITLGKGHLGMMEVTLEF